MNGPCIAFNPCFKCDEKEKCNICELTLYRNGALYNIGDVTEQVILVKVKPGDILYRVGEDYDSVHEEIVYRCELFKACMKIHTKSSGTGYYTCYDNEIDNDQRFYSTKEKAEAKIAEEKQKYQNSPIWIMKGTTKICPYCEAEYRLKTFGNFSGHGGVYVEYQDYGVHRKCVKCNRYVREKNDEQR